MYNMAIASFSELAVVFTLCAVAYTYTYVKRTKARYASLPPGPSGDWPFGTIKNVTGP